MLVLCSAPFWGCGMITVGILSGYALVLVIIDYYWLLLGVSVCFWTRREVRVGLLVSTINHVMCVFGGVLWCVWWCIWWCVLVDGEKISEIMMIGWCDKACCVWLSVLWVDWVHVISWFCVCFCDVTFSVPWVDCTPMVVFEVVCVPRWRISGCIRKCPDFAPLLFTSWLLWDRISLFQPGKMGVIMSVFRSFEDVLVVLYCWLRYHCDGRNSFDRGVQDLRCS